MNIVEFREKYPQYEDMPDEQLAEALHKKHYSDMPREVFDEKFLVKTTELPTEAPTIPVVEPEAKVEPEPLTVPDDLMITAQAVTDNGKKVKYKANAKEALKDVEERLTLYGKMMESLG